MFLFSLFYFASSNLFTVTDDESLSKLLKKKELVVVLFFSGNFPSLSEYTSIFDSLYSNFYRSVTVVGCDFGASPSVLKKYPIIFNPDILVFKHGAFAGNYEGDWTEDALSKFISDLNALNSNPNSHQNNQNSAEIPQKYEPIIHLKKLEQFQKIKPFNIIVYSYQDNSFFNELYNNLNVQSYMKMIGLVSDSNLAKKAGISEFPIIQLTFPFEEKTYLFKSYDIKKLQKLLIPTVHQIHNNQLAWSSAQTQWILFGFVQNHDENHAHQVSRILNHCNKIFGDSVLYEYGEFLDCFDLAKLVGIRKPTQPYFIAFKNDPNNPKNVPFLYKGDINPTDVRIWMKSQMKMLDQIEKKTIEFGYKNTKPVSFISSKELREYDTTALFVLFGNPQTDSNNYFQIYEMLCHLRDIFVNSTRIEFFLFNPATQNTQKVTVPFNFDEVTLLLYPSKTNKKYHKLNTTNGFKAMLGEVLPLVKRDLSKSTKNFLIEKFRDDEEIKIDL
ncbi:hypothetical protein TRFO_30446 [Tritrichomonas foetus]|uniref:Thioredoxin domain-containing protein n=1 Tax=Tritrichomonas foetus TaxID=1144522 RepID=A0A1J4JYU7_9EUKA|nr:hypothetical protein TRFO_30446 [Tritrichomonas foetus]|eukprot:OHT02445.1 hypothetical protein TRFO_30446 [Tritrichomonas foetus]